MQTLILVFDDHADGQAYLQERHYVAPKDAIPTATKLVDKHDHVLLMKETTYTIIPHDFLTLKANSIEFYRRG